MTSRRTFLATIAAATATACATGTPLASLPIIPAPPFALPPPIPPSLRGVNVITYGAIDPAVLQHLAALGSLTLRCPFQSLDQLWAIVGSLAPYPSLSLVPLIEPIDDTLVAALAASSLLRVMAPHIVGIGLGNEPDLANVSAADAHAWTQRSYTTLRAAGYSGDVFAPSIYCVQSDHLHDYAFPLWQNLPDDVVFDVHRYGDPDSGQSGYTSRLDEIRTIRNMIGPDRRVVISEVGWPTRTDADIAWTLGAASRDQQWAQALGAIGWYYYQAIDGMGMGDIDHYGLRRVDGSWKGLDGIFA